MEARQPSFMLLPSFGFLPDRDIHLGTILTTAKGSKLPDPKRPLNKQQRVSIDPNDIQEQTYKPWSWDSSKSSSTKVGLNANFSLFTGIGAGVSHKGGTTKSLKLSSDVMRINTFTPDNTYLTKALQHDLVRTVGWKLTRPRLYMIIGLMVSSGTSVEVNSEHSSSASGNLSTDLTSLNVPINAGPEVGHTNATKSKLAGVPVEPFVLAYELLGIRKKRDGTVEERDENSWALFTDEVPSEQNETNDWEFHMVRPEELIGD